MNVFLDSSALVKRYIDEPGSEDLERHLSAASTVAVSVLAPIEVTSALVRRRRESRLSSRQFASCREALAADLGGMTLVAITEDVITAAMDTVDRWPVRGADAVHVASASVWSADVFISADQAQLRAARGHGLRVEPLPLK